MDYLKIATLDEAKVYFKTLWQPMESECVLKNLQKILNFLQSPADEVCFVNMQEKYMPFYYMIILDEEFLQTTFLTDECKVVVNEILKALEANKNSFTWEVSFSTQIAGIPVIFRKVYTQPPHSYPREFTEPIRSEFKETWIKTTLNFIKSSRRILKYPEMPRREARYLYKGILKLKEDDIEPDTLWAPVWEALKLFKLRYEYIVSIHSTCFDYLKFVHFEKVVIRRRSCAVEIANSVASLEMNSNQKKLLTDEKTGDGIHRKANDLLIPVINHDELVKRLLEMNVTKSGTIVYTLKIDGSNITKEPNNELQEEVNQSSDSNNATDILSLSEIQVVQSDTTHEDTNVDSANDELENVNLTLVVQREVNTVDVQHTDVIISTANENDLGVSQETSTNNTNYQNETACNDEVSTPNLECNDSKESDGIVAKEKMTLPEIKPSNIENVSAIEQVKETEALLPEPDVIELNSDENVASNDIIIIDDDPDVTDVSNTVLPENTAKCDNIQTEVIEVDNDGNIDKMPIEVDGCSSDKNLDTEIIVIDENEELSKTDETKSINSNPFLQQITKVQKNNSPLFLQEEDFIPTEDINDLNCNIDDLVLKKKMNSINFNETSEVYRYLNEKENLKKTTKPQPSLKSQLKREEKMQRRFEKQIRKKRRLIENVPTKFILTSFKTILDFVNDDSRASMEMVGLNIHEFNFLKKLHGFSPNELPIEQLFSYSCMAIVIQLFNRLNEINVTVEIIWVKPSVYDKKTKTEENTRGRTLLFIKRPFKKPQYIKNQKSILEKMRLMPPPGRTKVSPGRRKVSRSPSVSPVRPLKSPARPLMTPAIPARSPASVRSEWSKNNEVIDLEEKYTDKSVSSRPNAPTGNVAVAMKAKMLEGLSVPLASDKAMRMMRLMGWNGGALGVRGVGLIEPIQPQLDVPKGVGLGHKMFKSTQLSINKLQKKVMYEKYMLEKSTVTAKVDDSRDVSNINEDKHNSININNNNNKDTDLKSVELTVNNNVVETPKGSGWLTNDSLLQKIKDKTSNNEAKQKIDTSAKEKTTGNSSNKEDIIETNGDEKTKYEEIVIRLRNMNEEGHEKWRVVDDEKLEPYTRESKTKHLSNRMQFLVHLLDLLQTEKSSTGVSFLKKPTGVCVGFIDSIIWALNHREEPTPAPEFREGRIVEACAKEMEAHRTLMLSYEFKNKFLKLQKSDGSSNFNPFLAEAFSELELKITHFVHDLHLYKLIPQGTKGVMRTKIFTNRLILDFVKSGDEERVYFFGKTSVEVRMYIISLISLLNRQMTLYQLGLGNSEHPVFRETLHWMQNVCLLYRFDTQDSYYKTLQLVKVDLERRCRVGRLAKESINFRNQADNPLPNDDKNGDDSYDVDIYPNIFDNSIDDVTKSDSDLVTEKNTECLRANFKPCDTDEIRQTDDCEEYLIGEDWLNSDVQGETVTKEISGSGRNDLNDEENVSNNLKRYSQTEAFNIEDTEENDIKRNALHEELSSDFHNWPKRIKRNETNHNILDQNVKWNTPEKYYKTNVEDPKRKINKQKADENVIESNASDNLIKSFDDSQNTLDRTDNNKENEDLNIEKRRKNAIDDIDKEAAKTNTLIPDVITADEKVAKDKLEVINQAIKTIKYTNSETLPDDNNWPKNLFIVHCDYPKIEICKYGAIGLQSILYEAIKKYRYLPRLKCCGLKNRGIVYTCYDFDSYIWLYDHLPLYKILVYENELHSKHVIRMKVNTFIKFDIEGIFKNIEKFYENIKTDTWKVVTTRDFADYCEIDIEVDNSSLQSIRKEDFSLFIGIDKADVSVLYHN